MLICRVSAADEQRGINGAVRGGRAKATARGTGNLKRASPLPMDATVLSFEGSVSFPNPQNRATPRRSLGTSLGQTLGPDLALEAAQQARPLRYILEFHAGLMSHHTAKLFSCIEKICLHVWHLFMQIKNGENMSDFFHHFVLKLCRNVAFPTPCPFPILSSFGPFPSHLFQTKRKAKIRMATTARVWTTCLHSSVHAAYPGL